MAKIKANFDYDSEIDSLYIYVPKKSKSERVASVSAGEYYTLDILIKGQMLKFKGLEINDVSKWLIRPIQTKSGTKVTPKQILKNIQSINLETRFSNDCLFVSFLITAVVKNEKVESNQAIPILIRH